MWETVYQAEQVCIKPANSILQARDIGTFYQKVHIFFHSIILYLEALCCFTQVQSKVLHRVVYSLQREHSCVLLKGVSRFWHGGQSPHPRIIWCQKSTCPAGHFWAMPSCWEDSSYVSGHSCCCVWCLQTAIQTKKPDKFCL